jgi:hypothetical protein
MKSGKRDLTAGMYMMVRRRLTASMSNIMFKLPKTVSAERIRSYCKLKSAWLHSSITVMLK